MYKTILALAAILIVFSGCSKKEEPKKPEAGVEASAPAVPVRGGKILEVIQTSAYSYLRVEEEAGEVWLAVQKMDVKEGENIYFTQSMEMKNFEGKEANKTFETILFVNDPSKDKASFGGQVGSPADLPADFKHPEQAGVAKEDVKVEKAAGGVTVADVFAKKSELKDKKIKIRGKVTKVNAGIMNTNWIHIQDGTASGKEYDLTLTSADVPTVGQIILIEGKVSVDKDFGAGYKYDVIVEEAKILEKK
ncbi:MAG: hypothetical protein IPJ75_08230 [Ignavibacteriales bacterium]|nr:hypothetical protein [Ignavibacteriales bacterium]